MAAQSNSPQNSDTIKRLREAVAELERRSRALGSGKLRHDVGNAVGAARNALSLLDEPETMDGGKILDIAQRNVDRAKSLMSGALADAPPREPESGRDERNDLRRQREGDDGDSVGF